VLDLIHPLLFECGHALVAEELMWAKASESSGPVTCSRQIRRSVGLRPHAP
jgi:hypothetical protein